MFEPSKPPRVSRQAGITLIELVIGMGILGVILFAASSLLVGNQRVTLEQQTRTNALSDARAAISRITEAVSSAAYIYPQGSTITVAGGLVGQGAPNKVVTGANAIAILEPDGTRSNPRTYNGVIYYLADRNDPKFAADLPALGADRISPWVLVEARSVAIGSIAWPKDTLPPTSWALSTLTEGVLVDGIDVLNNNTHLMSTATLAPTAGIDGTAFKDGLQGTAATASSPDALLSTLGFQLGISVAVPGKTLANSGTTVLRGLANPRNVPRR